MRDIHKIHLELVIRRCVVFTVNLGISRKTGLALEPALEFGHFFHVFFSDLRTFGTGSYNGEIACKDIDQLTLVGEGYWAMPWPEGLANSERVTHELPMSPEALDDMTRWLEEQAAAIPT